MHVIYVQMIATVALESGVTGNNGLLVLHHVTVGSAYVKGIVSQ